MNGSEIVIKYTGCTVTKPAGKGWVVKGGRALPNKLKSTSLNATPTAVKFEPETGTEFGALTIENPTVTALNGTFPVKGTEIAVPRGAFLNTRGSVSDDTRQPSPGTAQREHHRRRAWTSHHELKRALKRGGVLSSKVLARCARRSWKRPQKLD
jgi:hypothetical protein